MAGTTQATQPPARRVASASVRTCGTMLKPVALPATKKRTMSTTTSTVRMAASDSYAYRRPRRSS